jgi:hypothetical protein
MALTSSLFRFAHADFIFLTLKLTILKLFKLTLEQTVYRLYMPLDFSGFMFHAQ